MNKFISFGKILVFVMLFGLLPLSAFAEQKTVDGVTITYEPLSDGKYKVIDIINKNPNQIEIIIDGKYPYTINPGGSGKPNREATKKVVLTIGGKIIAEMLRCETPAPTPTVKETTPVEVKKEDQAHEKEPTSNSKPEPVGGRKDELTPMPEPEVIPSVKTILDQDSFFGESNVLDFVKKANSFVTELSEVKDKEQFIKDNSIKKFITDSEAEIKVKGSEIPTTAPEIVRSAKITDKKSQEYILGQLISLMNIRLEKRKEALDNLKKAVESISADKEDDSSLVGSIINYVIIVLIVVAVVGWVVVVMRKKKSKSKSRVQAGSIQSQHSESDSNSPAIVVRRRTTSILKKQSLDDVIGNPEYMLIHSSEFTPDSAVRDIYIKNTCIKDVYNMYAEDLRNTENPKEDGCMVLGRWVFDEENKAYDISLETVVFPGDDAVFKEYELNFGGKIKLRIAEKLRKLRRETNLQYDLVCWIHSHPGLGVFFSNSDDTVQMQLKHSQHPNFLIAFVVDILTETQEMAIFTFRKDGTMNSKGDITKMYSLEDMYKWALESEKVSFNRDNYYNILRTANVRLPICKGIELNNSSIIDITQILTDPIPGVVGWVIGTPKDTDGNKEYVVSSVVKASDKPTTGVIGALINLPHMSLPTIQRLIASENSKPAFVIVYSSRMNTLTSIPIITGELITDEHLYGEETIDDLKIWTRRKR